jgi:hypothetical protein
VTGKNEVTLKLVASMKNPEFVKYNIVFVLFRFIQNILVFYLAFQFFSFFIRDKSLVLIAILLLTLFMGNSVVDSDYTFNTYMDITVYLAAALVIVNAYNIWWILLITIVGALNRETSILVPALVFCSKVDWRAWPQIGKILFFDKRLLTVTIVSYLAFISIFIYLRVYYGYEAASTWRVPPGLPMLKLNLFSAASAKTYMEFFGVFGFLPFWYLMKFTKMNTTLKVFFWVLIPVWFGVHITTSIGFQSRLFLVPVVLVFIPSVFEYVEKSIVANSKTSLKM